MSKHSGGDDLGSDDEFLSAPIVGSDSDSDEEQDQEENQEQSTTLAASKKRSRDDAPVPTPSSNKKQRRQFLATARMLYDKPESEQAEFISNLIDRPVTASKMLRPTCTKGTFLEKLMSAVSKKQLKRHKSSGVYTPCVTIVCLSARRAVAVLKELTPAKLRVVKLFPKHKSLEDQQEELAGFAKGGPIPPVAIGTPHRIQALCDGDHLNLSQSNLVVLDAHNDGKGFTVLTMSDTAPHVESLISEHVLKDKESTAKIGIF